MLWIKCIEIQVAVSDVQSHRPEFMLLHTFAECTLVCDIDFGTGFKSCKQGIDIIGIIFIDLIAGNLLISPRKCL